MVEDEVWAHAFTTRCRRSKLNDAGYVTTIAFFGCMTQQLGACKVSQFELLHLDKGMIACGLT